MDRFICIHGHFYQPPRENPWLEAIEPQDSAHPFENWNERVSAECYEPNANARILDENGLIRNIVNNYARLSFNFGPTLLLWLEHEAPEVYASILEADRLSAERFAGHGSALAMPFNHMIMPLANERDRITQVRWGIRDFEYRFKRRPEGMWLPETAVDTPTLRVLAEEGIRFTILAPGQAGRVRRSHVPAWRDVSGGKVDPSEPYRVNLGGQNEISVFFYDGPVASAVAFEHLLRAGEALVERLMGAFPPKGDGPRLVHIATDGESYGHHHRFGEMALAYALEQIEQRDDVRLINYAEFLDVRPPTLEVEIVENSSWSCAHGVERWRSDCGCHTGSFPRGNQAWREPLRQAMDAFRDAVAPEFEEAAAPLVADDPWDVRNAYIDVILQPGESAIDRFLADHGRKNLSGDEQSRLLQLLEMQRHLMYMYTSCGWFFDDLAGIEAVQCLQYAARAIQLAGNLFDAPYEQEFLQTLSEARSNDPERGDGEAVYRDLVLPASVDFHRVGAHFVVWSLFEPKGNHRSVYAYDLRMEDYKRWEDGLLRLVLARGEVRSRVTREKADLALAAFYIGGHNLNAAIQDDPGETKMREITESAGNLFMQGDFAALIRLLDEELACCTFSLNSLFRSERQKVIRFILSETLSEAERSLREIYERNAPLMRFLADIRMQAPPVFRLASEYVIHAELEDAFRQEPLDPGAISRLLEECRKERIDLKPDGLAIALEQALYKTARNLSESGFNIEALRRMRVAVALALSAPFSLNLYRVQNAFFRMIEHPYAENKRKASEGDREADQWTRLFREIAADLAVRVE